MADAKAQSSGWIGTILNEKWRIDGRIARGGVATVFRASDVQGGPSVAIKIMHPEYSRNADVRRRFRREGYAANKVDHPGVVRVIADDSTADGSAYIVMELVDGGEELEILREKAGGRLPYLDVARACDQVLDVLAAAHQKGIIHRDIKPENVMMLPDGSAKVLDFGIAHFKETALEAEATATGLVLGTPEYMSPEQALGKRGSIDEKTDIFATGAMMFTLLSGQAVHISDVLSLLLQAQATRQARSLYAAARDLPRELIAVVDKALMLEKHLRWPSARAMQEALRKAVPQMKPFVHARAKPIASFASIASSPDPSTPAKPAAPKAAASIDAAEPITMARATAAREGGRAWEPGSRSQPEAPKPPSPKAKPSLPPPAPPPPAGTPRSGVSAAPPRPSAPPRPRGFEPAPLSQPTTVMAQHKSIPPPQKASSLSSLSAGDDDEEASPLSGPTQILATGERRAAPDSARTAPTIARDMKAGAPAKAKDDEDNSEDDDGLDMDGPTVGMLGAPARPPPALAKPAGDDPEATQRIPSSPDVSATAQGSSPSSIDEATRGHDLHALLEQQRTRDLGAFRPPPAPITPNPLRTHLQQHVTPHQPFSPHDPSQPQPPFGSWMPPPGPGASFPRQANTQPTVPGQKRDDGPSMLVLSALAAVVFFVVLVGGCLFMRR